MLSKGFQQQGPALQGLQLGPCRAVVQSPAEQYHHLHTHHEVAGVNEVMVKHASHHSQVHSSYSCHRLLTKLTAFHFVVHLLLTSGLHLNHHTCALLEVCLESSAEFNLSKMLMNATVYLSRLGAHRKLKSGTVCEAEACLTQTSHEPKCMDSHVDVSVQQTHLYRLY